MDFIERLLGVSPDGGSGAYEVMLLSLPLVIGIWLLARRQRRRQRP